MSCKYTRCKDVLNIYSHHFGHKEDSAPDEGGLFSAACPLSSNDFELPTKQKRIQGTKSLFKLLADLFKCLAQQRRKLDCVNLWRHHVQAILLENTEPDLPGDHTRNEEVLH